MYRIKHFIPQLIMLAIIIFGISAGLVYDGVLQTSATGETRRTVIIDAGHGGLLNTIYQLKMLS